MHDTSEVDVYSFNLVSMTGKKKIFKTTILNTGHNITSHDYLESSQILD